MLAVGDSTALEIIFSTRTYNRRMTKRPSIETNGGPPNPHVEIIATVTDRPDSTYPLLISPYKLDLSQFGEKVRDEITFEITNISDETVHITDVFMPVNEYFEVDLPKSIKPGKTEEATLQLDEEVLDESFEKSFTIQLDDGNTTRFTIPVKRTLRTPAQAGATTKDNSRSNHPDRTRPKSKRENTVTNTAGGGK